MEPPATISAPEATEPTTITSPSGCTMLWPERIALFNSKEFGRAAGDGGAAAMAEAALEAVVAGSELESEKGAGAAASPAPGGVSPEVALACRPLRSSGGIAKSSQDGSAPSIPMTLIFRLVKFCRSSARPALPGCSVATSSTVGRPKKNPGDRSSQASKSESQLSIVDS